MSDTSVLRINVIVIPQDNPEMITVPVSVMDNDTVLQAESKLPAPRNSNGTITTPRNNEITAIEGVDDGT